MIDILKYPQEASVSTRDRLFVLREKPGGNAPVIVVNYYGGILLGHNNDRNKKNYNLDWQDRSWDYKFYLVLSEDLLNKIVENNEIEKVVREVCNVIHRPLVEYLFPADIKVLKKVLDYYNEISKPKRYISFINNIYENKDEVWVKPLESIEDAEIYIRIMHEHSDYFGPEFEKNKTGQIDIIITDDERLRGMYRCVLSLQEFKEVCGKHMDIEVCEYFIRVWEGELDWAHKFWTYDEFNHFGTYIYSDDYPKWDYRMKIKV